MGELKLTMPRFGGLGHNLKELIRGQWLPLGLTYGNNYRLIMHLYKAFFASCILDSIFLFVAHLDFQKASLPSLISPH